MLGPHPAAPALPARGTLSSSPGKQQRPVDCAPVPAPAGKHRLYRQCPDGVIKQPVQQCTGQHVSCVCALVHTYMLGCISCLIFCKGLHIQDSLPERQRSSRRFSPNLPGSFSSAPEASWRNLGGHLPSLRQLSMGPPWRA